MEEVLLNVYTALSRWAVPALAGLLLLRCVLPLISFRREPEIWAWLVLPDGRRLPITHWESVIGRSRRSDVVIDLPKIARSHAVLTRYDDGSWSVTAASPKARVLVNGKAVAVAPLEQEDVLSLGGVEMTLLPISRRQEIKLHQLRTRAARPLSSVFNVLVLTALQAVLCTGYLLHDGGENAGRLLMGFGGLAAAQWALLCFYLLLRKPSFEIEALAFFLCTLGMAAIAAVKPAEMGKQLAAVGIGICIFLAVGWSLRDLERAKRMRYLAAVAGIGLLAVTLVFGKEYHGARNWLSIFGMSVQPSELSKVCFVYVGASTMERIVTRRNLLMFIVYSVVLCGCLALMNDFGTALIFFVAFLVIAYMRSGSVGTLGLACTSLGFAGMIALRLAPHALTRFTVWRHIWEDPLGAGYQQTRALMCIASGGLLGLGAGNGWMRHVFAADCDVVFATISEEWGLLTAFSAVAAVLALAVFAVRATAVQRSSFTAIAACTAASILTVQAMFNVLGTLDILPLTGVTFPFVSNGGSSMMGVWGLLAFLKAADTRRNASFAVRVTKEGWVEEDE